MLDGGVVVTAFAPDGATPDGSVAAITPAGGTVATTSAPALDGARLVALEDGRMLAVGGDTGVAADGVARVTDYDPTADRWSTRVPTRSPSPGLPDGRPEDQPGPLDGPALVRLADGDVLVLGGEPSPSRHAWVYRPSLIGSSSGIVAATPTAPGTAGVLVPSDPSTVDRSAGWVLTATGDDLAARALVGGPRLSRGHVEATVNVLAGGFALIAQQTAPGRALVAHLIPGEALAIEDGGEIVCSGDPVVLPTNPVTASLEIGDSISVIVDEAVVLSCDHEATAAGSWGIAADGAGAQISVATVTVAR
jgi:hypothetical protein